MEASIKANRITDFVRLLQCASKFGDDLNISANAHLWELAVTNSSKSAFCLFKLHRAFFCRYKALGTTVEQRRGVKCQLLVKSLLAVLGKTSAAGNVERVDLKIHDPDHSLGGRRKRRGRRDTTESNGRTTDEEESEDEVGSTIESMLIMKLVCKHGVIKRHSLHLGQTEFLRADVDPDTTPSGFLIDARTLRDWLDHFHIGLTSSHVTTSAGTTTIRQENQLSWLFSRDEVRVKSWEGGSRELSTEIKVDPGEFVDYEVFNGRVDLTLPMREFRATLALADQLSIRLVVAFSEAGQPFTLTSEVFDDGDPVPFDIFCAIATTTCDQFVTVKTPSDPPPSNGGQASRSRSVSGFLNRTTSGSRNGSMNGLTSQRSGSVGNGQADKNGDDGGRGPEDGGGDGDGERNVRRRTGSERPPSVRPRLSMSNRPSPSHVSNSMTTGLARTATVSGAGESDSHDDSHDQETNALFLSGGSQADLDDTATATGTGTAKNTGAGPSNTQTHTHTHSHSHSQTQPRLTQREVEELTGLEDLDAVMEAMDDEQHEEELEEMRASQRENPQDEEQEDDPGAGAGAKQSILSIQNPTGPVAPPPAEVAGTSQAERRPSQPRLPLGDITLEMDESIFGPVAHPPEEEPTTTVEETMDQVLAERDPSPEITIEPAPFDIGYQEKEKEQEIDQSRDEEMPIVPPEPEPESAEVEVAARVEERAMNQQMNEEDDEEPLPPTQMGSPTEAPTASFVRQARTKAMSRKFTELFED